MARSARRRVEHHDWRSSASEEDLREYGAFGPWTYEFKAERDTPKRFRAACARQYNARFLVKAPRGIDRRDTRPGMDLYVAVLAANDHGVGLMRLTGESVVTQDLVWSDVAVRLSRVRSAFPSSFRLPFSVLAIRPTCARQLGTRL